VPQSWPYSERTQPAPHPDPLLRVLSRGGTLTSRSTRMRPRCGLSSGRGLAPLCRFPSRWPASSFRPASGVVQHRLASPHRHHRTRPTPLFSSDRLRPPHEDVRVTRQSRWPQVADSPTSCGFRVLARAEEYRPHQATRMPCGPRTTLRRSCSNRIFGQAPHAARNRRRRLPPRILRMSASAK
jgi:hypothetical protein